MRTVLLPCLLALAACAGDQPAARAPTSPAAASPATTAPAAAATAAVPADLRDWVADAGAPARLRLRSAPGTALGWTVRDWDGREVLTGTNPVGADGVAILAPSLAEGWYELTAGTSTLGLIVRPAATGAPDPFFCIDAVIGELVPDAARREQMAGLLPVLGIAMARERLHWYGVQPKPDQLVWNARFHEDDLRRIYAANRTGVLEMSHHPPGWISRAGGVIPQDPLATARGWQAMAGHWRTTTAAVETWNEPDAPEYSGDATPDALAAHARAVAWGVRQGAPEALVCSSGFTKGMDDAYLRMVCANGLLAASDAMSIHDYREPEAIAPWMTSLRRILAESGEPAIPLWITESGMPWTSGTPRPAAADDQHSAYAIAMRAAEARAAGAARYFAFALPAYAEGSRSFGMTGTDGTPLRSLAAYGCMARRLAGLDYAGDLTLAGARWCHVFAGAGRRIGVAALAGTSIALPEALVRSVHGLDGRRLAPAAGSYAASERAVIIELAAQAVPDVTSGPLMDLWQAARSPRPRPALQPVQVQIVPVPGEVVPCQTRYTVATVAGGSHLCARITNFAVTEAVGVTLTLSAPEGEIVDGAARTASIPPGGSIDVGWRVTARANSGWRIDGRTADGVALQPVVFRVQPEIDGEALLARLPADRRRALSADEWLRCDRNVGATCTLTPAALADGSWRLGFDFRGQGNGNWAFPRVRLPADARFDRYDAILIRARSARPATVRFFAFESGGGGNIGWFTRDTAMASDGAWHWMLIRLADLEHCWAAEKDPNGILDRAAIDRISLGLNSQFSPDNRIDIAAAVLLALD